MFYAIDFVSKSVILKSENGSALADYIFYNELDLALVNSEITLCTQFSLNDMLDIYEELTLERKEFAGEFKAAAACWEALEQCQDDFPNFIDTTNNKLNSRLTLNRYEPLRLAEHNCRRGSILHTIVTAVDEELCETVGEVLDYIVSNYIIPKTGELADIKFAEHNIKYFIKQGKIVVGEEL